MEPPKLKTKPPSFVPAIFEGAYGITGVLEYFTIARFV